MVDELNTTGIKQICYLAPLGHDVVFWLFLLWLFVRLFRDLG
jgi:hypothetical protein